MKKKLFLLPALVVLPLTLGACDLLKNDKEIVYDSFETFNSLPEKNYSSSFSFEHDADWDLSFLNNSLISINNNVFKNQEDIELIYSELGSVNTTNFLNFSKVKDDYHLSANTLIDQFNNQFEMKEKNELNELDNLFVNDFSSSSLEKIRRISAFPFDSFSKMKDSLPKEKFVDITENIELNQDVDVAINLVLNSSEVLKYLPEFKEYLIDQANYTFFIKDNQLKTVEFSYILDWTNDKNKESIIFLTDFSYENKKIKPLDVSNKISLSKFLDSFDVSDEDLTKHEIDNSTNEKSNKVDIEENTSSEETKTE